MSSRHWLSVSFLRNLTGRQSVRQFIKFSLVGTVNTGLDFGLYLVLTRLTDFWPEHPVAASATAFSAAVLFSFIVNTFWTFRCAERGWQGRVVPFFAVAVVGLAVNSLTVWLVMSVGVWDVVAKAVATAVSLSWNFTMQKRLTFRIR